MACQIDIQEIALDGFLVRSNHLSVKLPAKMNFRSWPTTAAHRLELKCAASDMNGKGHALRPPFRDWGLSTNFAALHRDPTVALRPQCLRSAESGATACAARAADAGAERSDGPKGCSVPLPSGRAEEHSFRRIRAARCLSRRRVCANPA